MLNLNKVVDQLLNHQLSVRDVVESVRKATAAGALVGAGYSGYKAHKKGKRGKALLKAAGYGAGIGGSLGLAARSAGSVAADVGRLVKHGKPSGPHGPDLQRLLKHRIKMKTLGTVGGVGLAAKLHARRKRQNKHAKR